MLFASSDSRTEYRHKAKVDQQSAAGNR